MAHELFTEIKKDHDEMKEIFGKLEKSGKKASKTKENSFIDLKKELLPHQKSEEKHFYSALKEQKEAEDEALEGLEEHHVAETVLKELDKLPMDAENWSAKLKVLRELVEHHMDEEEDEVFKAAEKALDDGTLDKILESFSKDKEKLREKM